MNQLISLDVTLSSESQSSQCKTQTPLRFYDKGQKRKFTTTTVTSVLVVISAFLLGFQPATAADGKSYSGSQCRPVASGSLSNVGFSLRGGIQNISPTSNVRVVCPAVRDTAASFTGKVFVVNGSKSRLLTCELKSIASNGAQLGRDSKSVSFSSASVRTMSFNSSIRGAGDAAIFYECVIPRVQNGLFSEIVGYSIREN